MAWLLPELKSSLTIINSVNINLEEYRKRLYALTRKEFTQTVNTFLQELARIYSELDTALFNNNILHTQRELAINLRAIATIARDKCVTQHHKNDGRLRRISEEDTLLSNDQLCDEWAKLLLTLLQQRRIRYPSFLTSTGAIEVFIQPGQTL